MLAAASVLLQLAKLVRILLSHEKLGPTSKKSCDCRLPPMHQSLPEKCRVLAESRAFFIGWPMDLIAPCFRSWPGPIPTERYAFRLCKLRKRRGLGVLLSNKYASEN